MNDYMAMVQKDKKILLNKYPSIVANPTVNTAAGTLFVTKVLGSTQVSPTQCAMDWMETVYDPVTNRSLTVVNGVTSDVRRRGILSYYIDTTEWFAQTPVFADISGFKLYPVSELIPACQFDPTYYNTSVGNRFPASATAQTIMKDFLNTGFNTSNIYVCPNTIPMYSFNAAHYKLANTTVTTDALADYKAKLNAGIATSVKLATDVAAITPITYTKPVPAESNLTNASGTCPTITCSDTDLLYDLITQYNSNPSFPGMILNVQKAYTAGPNQCDIEAQINFDAMITDIVSNATDPNTDEPIYAQIKKGTVDYKKGSGSKLIEINKAMTLSGIQTVNMPLYLDIDKQTCTYDLTYVGAVNAGYTIQPNTPYLYKALNYPLELQNRTAQTVGSSIAKIQSDFNAVSGSVKQAITNYRMNTYSAIGSINTLSCGRTCDQIAGTLQNSFNTGTNTPFKIASIDNVGTYNSNSCDLAVITTSNQRKGLRLTVDATCNYTGYLQINPTPTYSDIANVAVPLTTAAVSGFTNYVPPLTDDAYPLKARGFGIDRMRNSTDSVKEIQFMTPLKQEMPVTEKGNDTTTYRFLRFVPLKTRIPDAYSIEVQRINFFYQGQPLALQGRVTNPMGTWEGDIDAVTGPRATGWIDNHKKPLVFAFKAPSMIDAYSLTTSIGLTANDPISWKMEASSNGTFWTLVDSQPRFPTPIARGKDTDIISLTSQ